MRIGFKSAIPFVPGIPVLLIFGCLTGAKSASIEWPEETPHNIRLLSRYKRTYKGGTTTDFVITSDHLVMWYYHVERSNPIWGFYAYPLSLYPKESLRSPAENKYIWFDKELMEAHEKTTPLRLRPIFYRVVDGRIITTEYPFENIGFTLEAWRTDREKWLYDNDIIEARRFSDEFPGRWLHDILSLYNPELDRFPRPVTILEYEMLSQEYADAVRYINESWENYPVIQSGETITISRYPLEVAASEYDVDPDEIYSRIIDLGYEHTYTYNICSEIARELSER